VLSGDEIIKVMRLRIIITTTIKSYDGADDFESVHK
jgi:hypothetical protein